MSVRHFVIEALLTFAALGVLWLLWPVYKRILEVLFDRLASKPIFVQYLCAAAAGILLYGSVFAVLELVDWPFPAHWTRQE